MMQAFYHGSLLTHPIRSVGKTRIAVAKNERHTVGLDDSQKQEIRNARRRHVSLATIHGELISCYKKISRGCATLPENKRCRRLVECLHRYYHHHNTRRLRLTPLQLCNLDTSKTIVGILDFPLRQLKCRFY